MRLLLECQPAGSKPRARPLSMSLLLAQLSAPLFPLSSPQDPLSSPQDPLSAPQPPLSAPLVPLSAPQNPLSAPPAPLSAPLVPLSAPLVPLSAPQDPLSAPPVPLSAPTPQFTCLRPMPRWQQLPPGLITQGVLRALQVLAKVSIGSGSRLRYRARSSIQLRFALFSRPFFAQSTHWLMQNMDQRTSGTKTMAIPISSPGL